MRNALNWASLAVFFCAVLAPGQTAVINTYAGGGLPTNIVGTAASVGGLGNQVGYSLGGYSGALGRGVVDANGNLFFIAYNAVLELNPTTGLITLVAGNGTAGLSGDGGPATAAQLNAPFAVAVDGQDNVYIADTNNLRVRRVTASTGVISTIAGNGAKGYAGDGGSALGAQFLSLSGIAVDGNNNVYVADQAANVVRKISGGIITTYAGGGSSLGDNGAATSAQLNQPLGIAVDTGSNLYITDRANSRIRKVTAQNGVISTYAGNGSFGFSGDNAAANSAQLSFPDDVAVDPAGNVYIADTGNHRIRRVVTSGIITTIAGTGAQGFTGTSSATNAQFWNPTGVAADSLGGVYVSDSGNNRFSKISQGQVAVIIGGGASVGDGTVPVGAQLGYPSGIATDAGGNLYVADQINQRVRKISNGVITTVAGGGATLGDGGVPTNAQLLQPEAVAFDAAGNLYIADTAASRIRKVSSGVISTFAGTGALGSTGDGGQATSATIGWPVGLAVDASGNVYFSDQYSGKVRVVSSTGVITTYAGGGGTVGDGVAPTNAQIQPAGIAVDASGNLYIADQLNHKIRKIVGGLITTIAGNGSAAASGDGGPAINAGMNPVGIRVDSSGNIYVADSNNSRIRKVTAAGIISTIAGNGTLGFGGDGGPASSAQLYLPEDVAVDPSGNVYIADTGNNRIRSLGQGTTSGCTYTTSPNSLQPTTAGGTFPIGLLTGSGCAWTVAGLPSWITVSGASSGTGPATVTLVVAANTGASQTATISIGGATVTVTEGGSGTSGCTYTLSPGTLSPTSAGGSFPIGILTGASCSWSVTGLPNWISVSGTSSGTGPSTIVLVVAANSGPTQTAVISIGGTGLTVNQGGTAIQNCISSLSAGGQAFGPSGGGGSFTVTAPSSCSWTASSTASWITSSSSGSGNGTVTYQVQGNSGSARVASINISGLSYTVEQGASSISGFTNAGAMADLTVAGGWSTAVTLVNPSATSTQLRVNFFDVNGNPLTIPLTFPQSASSSGPLMASSIDRTLNPGAELQISTTGAASQATVSGWIQVLSSGSLNGFAAFRFTAGTLDHQALIPLENRNPTQLLVAFDNTGGYADGLAITNTSNTTAAVGFIVRDSGGNQTYSSSITIPPMSSTNFVLPTNYGFTSNTRGTVELDSPAAGQIAVLGIHYNTASGGFSTTPALVKQ